MTDQEAPPTEESPATHPGEWGTFDPRAIAEARTRRAADYQPYEQPEPLTDAAPAAFNEKYKEPFYGLLYIGALTDKFDFLGHEIIIRTLTVDDDLATGEVTKQWMGTAAAERAYITAIAAMCLVSIDGQEPPSPVGPDSSGFAWAYQRFNWLKANVFSFTIDRIYQRYVALEGTSREVLEAMEKASGSSVTASQSEENSPDGFTSTLGLPDSTAGPDASDS